MKTSELLKNAKAIIEDPANWTRYSYAKNSDKKETNILSRESVCFCSIGAVYKAIGTNPARLREMNQEEIFNAAYNYLDKAVRLIEGKEPIDCLPVAPWNDTHTHDEVMLMWDKAIELAIAEGN